MSSSHTPVYDTEVTIDWYRSPVDQAELKNLMQRSDFRGWLQTLGHLGWFITTGATAYVCFTHLDANNALYMMPLLLLSLFIHGTMGPFMGLIAIHELQHRTVFKSKGLCEFFEKLYAFLSWSDYIWYQESHAIHHRATCHAQHDGEVVLPVKFSLRQWQVWLGLLAWDPQQTWMRLKTTWLHARGEIRGDWYRTVLPVSQPKLRLRHERWAQGLLLGHGCLALLFVISGHWFLLVVFTFGTQYCRWLGFLCAVPQHYGLNPDIADFRQNTRTYTCSWLPGFYYWNMQYHLEHHMYPAVPFFNLPRLHELLKSDLPPAPHGLRATWREMLSIRDRKKVTPEYYHDPFTPAGS